jgi:uncharacterized protein YndB with AHSA1/START domain
MTDGTVRKELRVKAPREHAFAIFTDGIDRWWPREHHIGQSPLERTLIEPRIGGRWYSVCQDGSEVDVGRVEAWEPPGRLLIIWQINGSWQFDPTFRTEIEVRFESLGPRETRVVFEHRGLEAYGPATDQVRMMFEAPDGWAGTLARFVAETERRDAEPVSR